MIAEISEKPQVKEKIEVFAAFGQNHLAEILSIGLSKSALKLYLLLHTIAPFGNWYCWNDQVSERSIRVNLAGKSQNPDSIRRNYERARKELKERQLIAINRRGFRLLSPGSRPIPRKPKDQDLPDQQNAFSWARSRQNDRLQSPQTLLENDSGEGKDRSLNLNLNSSIHDLSNTKTPVLSQGDLESEPRMSGEGVNLGCTGSKATQITKARPKRIKKVLPPPVLEQKYLDELQRIGVEAKQVHANLVRAIAAYSWEQFVAAVDYVEMRVNRADLPKLFNLVGYLVQVMRAGYRLIKTVMPEPEVQRDTVQADQSEWLNLARSRGIIWGSTRMADGEIGVIVRPEEPMVPIAIAMQQHPLGSLG